MLAGYALGTDPQNALSCWGFGEVPEPITPADWVTVHVKAMSINHHDLWSMRGQGVTRFDAPLILGTDAAGVTDDGDEVIVHAVMGDPALGFGDETLDPGRSLLSEIYPGTFAERVRVPRRNLIAKPKELTWHETAALPTAWLTAYRMLTTRGTARAGETVLIQGAGGGVSTALVLLAKAMGLRVWVTSRDEAKREWILALGADAAFPSGAELPEPVDLVMETVGAATWSHSVHALRPGGRIVISGITSGAMPPADLLMILANVITVYGSVMGTAEEFNELNNFLVGTGVRPVIDSVLPISRGLDGLRAMDTGNVRGKIVLEPDWH